MFFNDKTITIIINDTLKSDDKLTHCIIDMLLT